MQASAREGAGTVIQRINHVWLDGQVDALAPMVDPEIVMVLPGFAGRIRGREQFLAGFRDFCENAQVLEFHDQDYESDVVGDTAVVTFRYDMIYKRSGERYRATGRDLWVLRGQGNEWIAVWRTMLEVQEEAAE
jgi:hypothetical protein